MEAPEIQSLIRDLDLTLQPRIAPRYKHWLPLATQQLRFRSLIQIIGYNLKAGVKCNKCCFYYTLHRTSMSSPLYTSELIDNTNPRWSSLEVPTLHATGHSAASEIILRLWRRATTGDTTSDVAMFAWGVSFTGLAYIGPKLPTNLETILRENSLILHLHGGYFTPSYCLLEVPDLRRYLHISVEISEIRDSYNVNKLSSLRSKMHALKQQSDSVRILRERIASGDNMQMPKYPQSSLNRLLHPKKLNREKKAEITRIRKSLEIAKFRTKLLEQERIRKMGELRTLTQLHASIMEENQDQGSDLMERYRELNRDIERLREWRLSHLDAREAYVQTTTQLTYRRRQLISELGLIYPIMREENGRFTINDVYLPDSEELGSSDETQVAVALGSVAHTTQMVANFLNIPTRYPITHCGSRSKVVDHITDSLPDKDRQFPLFARGKDKLQFHYAVYLLNKNIAQLRWYCGLPTLDLRATLPNLANLINVKPNQTMDGSKRTFSGSSLDMDMSSGQHHIPLTPPFRKVIFEKCHKPSRSIGQSKIAKSTLGSSLDQGLNKPIPSLVLSSQSKRICKSEESAIDNTSLSLTRDDYGCSSSNETLNQTVFDNINNTTINTREADFVRLNNATLVDSNIEIAIPTSVTKGKNTSESLDGSTRQRSSNSISSCEMALTSSQNDGEEHSNGNLASRNGKSNENVFLVDDKFADRRDIDLVPKLRESDDQIVPKESDAVDAGPSQEGYALSNQKHQSSIHDENKSTNLHPSLDDTRGSEDEAIEQKQTSSLSSGFSQEYSTARKMSRRRRYDSEPRQDGDEAQRFLENWCTSNPHGSSEEQLGHFGYDSLLDKGPLNPLSCLHPNNEEERFNDRQAATEYINSIRRSSENVYARTEALANKKTSFKVMRPRL